MKTRTKLLHEVAQQIIELTYLYVVRVAVDGVDGAGKTTFADELADALKSYGKSVIRTSIDDFHNPRAVRYQRGRGSSEGFYLDSYNYQELKSVLLDPLSPGGSGRYQTMIFDVTSDLPVIQAHEHAELGDILLIDGIFLQRPELRNYWDYSIFLEVPFEVSIPRGAARGAGFGSPDPEAETNRRYIEGQRQYLSECEPKRRASVTINNADLYAPFVVR